MKSYHTLQGVIGVREQKGSLAEYGITYRQVDLLSDGSFDYDKIRESINDKTKIVELLNVKQVYGEFEELHDQSERVIFVCRKG